MDTLKIEPLGETNPLSREILTIRFIYNKRYEDYHCDREVYDKWMNALRPRCIMKDFSNMYSCIKIIGKGSFAKVYLACSVDDHSAEFAIKSFDKRSLELNEKNKQSILMEINLMRTLNHPNILKVFEVYETGNHINLVLEILKGGELFERIVSHGAYSEKSAAVLMKQFLSALQYLHEKGIMHRDLKPENLILTSKDDSTTIKLADFGLATYTHLESQLFTRCGTPGYVAPEILDDLPYNEKVDIFSAGIILYILLTGCSPFYGKSYNEILVKNKKCRISFDFSKFKHKPSQSAVDLLKKMLEKDSNSRISAADALKHEWIITEGLRREENEGVDIETLQPMMTLQINMKQLQEGSHGLFDMTKLKPKEMNDENKLITKSPLITGRTNTIEESKESGFDSPSFRPLHRARQDDLRKQAIKNRVKNYSPENKKSVTKFVIRNYHVNTTFFFLSGLDFSPRERMKELRMKHR